MPVDLERRNLLKPGVDTGQAVEPSRSLAEHHQPPILAVADDEAS